MKTVVYEWKRENMVVTIEINYSYSKPVKATHLDPPEGGVEVDSIVATRIRWYAEDGKLCHSKATVDELTAAEQAFSANTAYLLADADHEACDESAREHAAEMKAGY